MEEEIQDQFRKAIWQMLAALVVVVHGAKVDAIRRFISAN